MSCSSPRRSSNSRTRNQPRVRRDMRSLERDPQQAVECELKRTVFFFTHQVSPSVVRLLASEPCKLRTRRLIRWVRYHGEIGNPGLGHSAASLVVGVQDGASASLVSYRYTLSRLPRQTSGAAEYRTRADLKACSFSRQCDARLDVTREAFSLSLQTNRCVTIGRVETRWMSHRCHWPTSPFFMGEYLAGGFSVRGAVSFRQPRFTCFDKINELVGATIVGGQ